MSAAELHARVKSKAFKLTVPLFASAQAGLFPLIEVTFLFFLSPPSGFHVHISMALLQVKGVF